MKEDKKTAKDKRKKKNKDNWKEREREEKKYGRKALMNVCSCGLEIIAFFLSFLYLRIPNIQIQSKASG
jgi:hypothetical protein